MQVVFLHCSSSELGFEGFGGSAGFGEQLLSEAGSVSVVLVVLLRVPPAFAGGVFNPVNP